MQCAIIKKMVIEHKWDRLRELLRGMDGAVLAYSGGVDSSLLLKAASETRGLHCIAVTAVSETYPEVELYPAQEFARTLGVMHRILPTEELSSDAFIRNDPDRCYYCKKELFGKLRQIADEAGIPFLLDGSNVDDLADHRPGMTAAREYSVRSPLIEAEFAKSEIRELAHRLKLPMWDKPSLACLSSRIPYGTRITSDVLKTIQSAENHLRGLGFHQVRVRHHGETARIEVDRDEFWRVLSEDHSRKITAFLKELGYTYVCLDLAGYRTGSMNEGVTRSRNAV